MVTKAEMKKLKAGFHRKMLASPDISPGKTIKMKSLGTLLSEKEQKRRKRF